MKRSPARHTAPLLVAAAAVVCARSAVAQSAPTEREREVREACRVYAETHPEWRRWFVGGESVALGFLLAAAAPHREGARSLTDEFRDGFALTLVGSAPFLVVERPLGEGWWTPRMRPCETLRDTHADDPALSARIDAAERAIVGYTPDHRGLLDASLTFAVYLVSVAGLYPLCLVSDAAWQAGCSGTLVATLFTGLLDSLLPTSGNVASGWLRRRRRAVGIVPLVAGGATGLALTGAF